MTVKFNFSVGHIPHFCPHYTDSLLMQKNPRVHLLAGYFFSDKPKYSSKLTKKSDSLCIRKTQQPKLIKQLQTCTLKIYRPNKIESTSKKMKTPPNRMKSSSKIISKQNPKIGNYQPNLHHLCFWYGKGYA